MANVSPRARWMVAAALGLVVAVAAVLVVLNRPRTVLRHDANSWVVQPGVMQTFLPSDVRAGDEYICPGTDRVVGTPEPGEYIVSPGGLVIVGLADGTVRAECHPSAGR
jgi:hypothetical protein